MPSDDLVINVRQISGYPPQQYVGPGDAVVVQSGGINGPYRSMSAQAFAATALGVNAILGLGVGSSLPPGSGGSIMAGRGFVSPLNTGLLFNAFVQDEGAGWQSGLSYLTSGVAGALVFDETGFVFLGFPAGDNLQPVVSVAAAATLSRNGQLSLRQQVSVGRDPIGPNEAVTLAYFTLHALVRNPGNGKLNLTTEDIVNAGGATQWNAALAGYPTAQSPVPEARGNEIVTAQWAREILVAGFNGRHGEICLTVDDITWAGGAPAFSPHLIGKPLAPTADLETDDDQIATTKFVNDAIDAVGTLTGPPGPPGPQGPQGTPGTGINFLGTVPTYADLPATGNEVGDMYITLDTNDGYIWEIAGGIVSGEPMTGQAGWILIGMITPQTAVLISVNPPINPTQGDLWWDNTTAQLMIYYAGQWVVANLGATGPQGPPGTPGAIGPAGPAGPMGGAEVAVGGTPPPSPTDGALWWNTTQGLLMVYLNGTWVSAAGGGAVSAAIGAAQLVPPNSIVPTGWGYVYGAVATQEWPGAPFANFMFCVQPELGFPGSSNVGTVMGDGQNAFLYASQVNLWNYGSVNNNLSLVTRVITGLPQPVPRASIQVAANSIMPQGFYYGGQLTSNQGFCRYTGLGGSEGGVNIPTASIELFYSDGINFLCTGNTIGSTATFVPVAVSGLNNGVIGPTIVFAHGALVPAGVWYAFATAANVQEGATLELVSPGVGYPNSPLNPRLNFMFFSDGTNIEVANGPIGLNQVNFS